VVIKDGSQFFSERANIPTSMNYPLQRLVFLFIAAHGGPGRAGGDQAMYIT
jgi:hypothetical protein